MTTSGELRGVARTAFNHVTNAGGAMREVETTSEDIERVSDVVRSGLSERRIHATSNDFSSETAAAAAQNAEEVQGIIGGLATGSAMEEQITASANAFRNTTSGLESAAAAEEEARTNFDAALADARDSVDQLRSIAAEVTSSSGEFQNLAAAAQQVLEGLMYGY